MEAKSRMRWLMDEFVEDFQAKPFWTSAAVQAANEASKALTIGAASSNPLDQVVDTTTASGYVAGLQKYTCHKTVWAAKIENICYDDGNKLAVLCLGGDLKIAVSQNYIHKHNPITGGYFVVYEGGYQSFSPADDFEKGYRKV